MKDNFFVGEDNYLVAEKDKALVEEDNFLVVVEDNFLVVVEDKFLVVVEDNFLVVVEDNFLVVVHLVEVLVMDKHLVEEDNFLVVVEDNFLGLEDKCLAVVDTTLEGNMNFMAYKSLEVVDNNLDNCLVLDPLDLIFVLE